MFKRILVGCEESRTVTKAFRAKGHEAYSCDILDCSGGHPEWHIKADILSVINDGWDMLIAHPPCTYMSNSGVRHLHTDPKRWIKLFEAAELFNELLDSDIPEISVENPIMHGYAKKLIGNRKQTQTVQPWMFGHKEQKATCLWLKNLPPLFETNNVKNEMMQLSHRERNRLHYLPPSPDRALLRSKTYKGIADAMAVQWG